MSATFQTDSVVAANLRTRRYFAKLTQSELAARMSANGLETSENTVRAVEAGRRRVTAAFLTAAAYALGEPVSDLLTPPGPVGEDVRLSGVPPRPRDEIRAWLRGETELDDEALFSYWNRNRKVWEKELVRVESARAELGDLATPETVNPLDMRAHDLRSDAKRARERMYELGPHLAKRVLGADG